MVVFKEYEKDGAKFLSIVKAKECDAREGYCFRILPPLSGPLAKTNVALSDDGLTELSRRMSNGFGDQAKNYYVLLSSSRHQRTDSNSFPLLGRRIIADGVKWGNFLKIPGEFSFIPKYWEWTEDVLDRCKKQLQDAGIFEAVYGSLYTYDRDRAIFRAFCEAWCPSTNTPHTLAGEASISLWDLRYLCGLPVSGVQYDETHPCLAELQSSDSTLHLPQTCRHLYAAYVWIPSRKSSSKYVTATEWIEFWFSGEKRYDKPPTRRKKKGGRPQFSHNPNGHIGRASAWIMKDLTLFDALGLHDATMREEVYLAAFLSCLLCAYVLPYGDNRDIQARTFRMISLMARGFRCSLAIPVLANIYRGLNHISQSDRPNTPKMYFPAHFLYGWLAHYFSTHHRILIVPEGPRIAEYPGEGGAKCYSEEDARLLIHSGDKIRWNVTNRLQREDKSLVDDGQLSHYYFSLLVGLRSASLVLRDEDSFYIEPYNPHRFCRQFGFCQSIPGNIKSTKRTCSYDIALSLLRKCLKQGTMHKVVIPTAPLAPSTTYAFESWWNGVRLTDLINKVEVLAESVLPKKKDKVSNVGMPTLETADVVNGPGVKANETTAGPYVHNVDSDDDDLRQSSNCNFKHARKRRKSDLSSDEEACASLSLVGEYHDKEMPSSATDEAKNNRSPPGDSKTEYSKNEVYVCEHHDGETYLPTVNEVKVDDLPPDTLKADSPHAPSQGRLYSRIRTQIIKDAGTRFLRELMAMPYDDVPDVHKDALDVYGLIERFGGDTSLLRAAMDSYVNAVTKFLALEKASLGKRPSSEVEQEKSLISNRLAEAQSRRSAFFRDNEACHTNLLSIRQEALKLEARLHQLKEEEQYVTAKLKKNESLLGSAEDDVSSI